MEVMNDASKGLTFRLPSETAARLRKNPTTSSDDNKDGDADFDCKQTTTVSEEGALPVISLDLERLIGYKPPLDEYDSIQSQLVGAMWTRFGRAADDNNDRASPMQPPPDFDLQIGELFSTGVASCGAKDSCLVIAYPPMLQTAPNKQLVKTSTLWKELLTYPTDLDFVARLWKFLRDCSQSLFWKQGMSMELRRLIEEEQTRLEYEEWTESKRQSKLDSLYSIRETLVHQLEMAEAKRDAMEEEREDKVRGVMQQYFRNLEGKGRLETFGTSELSFPDDFQLLGISDRIIDEQSLGLSSDNDDMISSGYGSEDEPFSSSEQGGEANNTLSDSHTHSPNNGIANHFLEDAVASEAQTTAESTVDDSNGENVAAVTLIVEENPTDNANALSLAFQKRKERREKAKRKKRQEKQAAERKAKKEQARAMEEETRSSLTTRDFILSQTLCNALQGKVEKVEELLESLQDEVWEAEEQQQETGETKRQVDDDNLPFSLLDQVLAMVLGTMPVEPGVTSAEHYKWVETEHKRLVRDWRRHFGRLPQPAEGASPEIGSTRDEEEAPEARNAPTISPSEQRRALGITENTTDDWEAVDDLIVDSNKAPDENETRIKEVPSEAPKPRLVGLRPGGSTKNREG